MAASKGTPNLLQADTQTLEVIVAINRNPLSGERHLCHALREVLDPKEARSKVEPVIGVENALVLVVLSGRCAVVDQPFLRHKMQNNCRMGLFHLFLSRQLNILRILLLPPC